MRISRFYESKKGSGKKKEENDSVKPFDVESTIIDKDVVGFKSQDEEMPKAAEKKLKKEIQVTTPGLKKSIKKFEEFILVIDLGGDEPSVGDVTNVDLPVADQTGTECACCDDCTGEVGCGCGCDDCQCGDVSSQTAVVPFGEFSEPFSEKLTYHIKNGVSVVENVFRPGSKSFIDLITESRKAHDAGRVRFMGQDRYLFENTDLGRFGEYAGQSVPLDLPFEQVDEVNEAEYHGKKVELNHPMRGGTKKYYVYVMNPKTHKVKKIAFGDVHGGLTAKVSDPKARKNFAARHNCKDKKDKTKAGYWACRVNRYGHLWGGKTYPGYW